MIERDRLGQNELVSCLTSTTDPIINKFTLRLYINVPPPPSQERSHTSTNNNILKILGPGKEEPAKLCRKRILYIKEAREKKKEKKRKRDNEEDGRDRE